jgi:rRNA biogenesis protein RRP5
LTRSLQSLSRHKHIEVITKFASAEFDLGVSAEMPGGIDRGRVVFEELIGSYPKRTDLWHVYLDKEIKAGAGHVTQARQLFERMLSGPRLNVKNVKTVFKKWMQFEKNRGNDETVAGVRARAKAYASSM